MFLLLTTLVATPTQLESPLELSLSETRIVLTSSDAACPDQAAVEAALHAMVDHGIISSPLSVEISRASDATIDARIVQESKTHTVTLPSCLHIAATVEALFGAHVPNANASPGPTTARPLVRLPLTSTMSDALDAPDQNNELVLSIGIGGLWVLAGGRAKRIGSGPGVFVGLRSRFGLVEPGLRVLFAVFLPTDAEFDDVGIGRRYDGVCHVDGELGFVVSPTIRVVPAFGVVGTVTVGTPENSRLDNASVLRLFGWGLAASIGGEFRSSANLSFIMSGSLVRRFDRLAFPLSRLDGSKVFAEGWAPWSGSASFGLQWKF